MNRLEEIYYQAKSDTWFKRFAVFCRIALAASFLPAGYVKIMGERFASGLPSNNPLGHYFDALHLTGYYYTFIGIVQIITAILLLIPRTSLLGALMYFPIILNICVLTYATRFDGTRLVTMMVLASLFLLLWDYDRLKHILPFKQAKTNLPVLKKTSVKRLRIVFFGGAFTAIAIIIIGTFYLYEIVPGNSEEECKNQCASSKYPAACEEFCDCIYRQGQPLDSCLANFNKANDMRKIWYEVANFQFSLDKSEVPTTNENRSPKWVLDFSRIKMEANMMSRPEKNSFNHIIKNWQLFSEHNQV